MFCVAARFLGGIREGFSMGIEGVKRPRLNGWKLWNITKEQAKVQDFHLSGGGS
jgi:hypothetical protein